VPALTFLNLLVRCPACSASACWCRRTPDQPTGPRGCHCAAGSVVMPPAAFLIEIAPTALKLIVAGPCWRVRLEAVMSAGYVCRDCGRKIAGVGIVAPCIGAELRGVQNVNLARTGSYCSRRSRNCSGEGRHGSSRQGRCRNQCLVCARVGSNLIGGTVRSLCGDIRASVERRIASYAVAVAHADVG
jgi:hypothetical protein